MAAPTPVVKTPVETPVEAPKTRTIELHPLQAVHGLLIHPYTETHFVTSKAIPHELDTWCKAQVDAGKLVIA